MKVNIWRHKSEYQLQWQAHVGYSIGLHLLGNFTCHQALFKVLSFSELLSNAWENSLSKDWPLAKPQTLMNNFWFAQENAGVIIRMNLNFRDKEHATRIAKLCVKRFTWKMRLKQNKFVNNFKRKKNSQILQTAINKLLAFTTNFTRQGVVNFKASEFNITDDHSTRVEESRRHCDGMELKESNTRGRHRDRKPPMDKVKDYNQSRRLKEPGRRPFGSVMQIIWPFSMHHITKMCKIEGLQSNRQVMATCWDAGHTTPPCGGLMRKVDGKPVTAQQPPFLGAFLWYSACQLHMNSRSLFKLFLSIVIHTTQKVAKSYMGFSTVLGA